MYIYIYFYFPWWVEAGNGNDNVRDSVTTLPVDSNYIGLRSDLQTHKICVSEEGSLFSRNLCFRFDLMDREDKS